MRVESRACRWSSYLRRAIGPARTIDVGNENSAFTSDRYQTSAEVDKAATVAHEVQRQSSALLLKTQS
jgi:hypothetical protein